jgi:hypothetical protein
MIQPQFEKNYTAPWVKNILEPRLGRIEAKRLVWRLCSLPKPEIKAVESGFADGLNLKCKKERKER